MKSLVNFVWYPIECTRILANRSSSAEDADVACDFLYLFFCGHSVLHTVLGDGYRKIRTLMLVVQNAKHRAQRSEGRRSEVEPREGMI